MQDIVQFNEAVLQRLETLARREGTTTSGLIQRIVENYATNYPTDDARRFRISLPLIPAAVTGPIQDVSGKDVDEMLSHDHRRTEFLDRCLFSRFCLTALVPFSQF